MKINLKKLSKDQLITLLHKVNYKLANSDQNSRYRKMYQCLVEEFRQRRELRPEKAPETVRRDLHNQFGIINREYFNALNHIDKEIYLNWKWEEL